MKSDKAAFNRKDGERLAQETVPFIFLSKEIRLRNNRIFQVQILEALLMPIKFDSYVTDFQGTLLSATREVHAVSVEITRATVPRHALYST